MFRSSLLLGAALALAGCGPVAFIAAAAATSTVVATGGGSGGGHGSGGGPPPAAAFIPLTGTGLPGGSMFAIAAVTSSPTSAYALMAPGLTVTRDGGTAWTNPASRPLTSSFRVVADPSDPARAFVPTARGLLITTDTGATWIERPTPTGVGGIAAVGSRQLVFGSQNNGFFYRSDDVGVVWTQVGTTRGISAQITVGPAGALLVGGSGGVERSVDGGATFTTTLDADVRRVAACARDPSRVFALVRTPKSQSTISVSSDGGVTWTQSLLPAVFVHDLAADPLDPAIGYAAADVDGLFVTRDGGATWISGNLVGHRVLTVSASQAVWAGTAAGALRSDDRGVSWHRTTPVGTTDIRHLAADPQEAGHLLLGTAGGVFESHDGGTSWSARNTGLTRFDVIQVAFDRADRSKLFAATDGGLFLDRAPGIWSLVLTDRVQLALDPVRPSRVYAGGPRGFGRSTDGGFTWTFTLLDQYAPSVFAASSGTVLAGTAQTVVRSTDGGETLTPEIHPAPLTGPVTLAGRASGEVVFLKGLRSFDEGRTWIRPRSDPDAPHPDTSYGLHVEPFGPRVFGSDRDGHLLVSFDLGDTWRLANDGLVGRVIGVAFDPTASGRVYVWTTEGVVFRGG